MTLFQFIWSMLSALQTPAFGVRLVYKPSSVGSKLGLYTVSQKCPKFDWL